MAGEEIDLTEDQQVYESLFGPQPDWHKPTTTDETNDDDAIYAAIFGTTD